MVGCSWFRSGYQGQDVEFRVDTGAAYTALSRDLVALLGIRSDPQRTAAIGPAHGRIVSVPIITLAELRVGGFRMTHVAAVVLQFPRELKLDGVLGMTFCGACHHRARGWAKQWDVMA